MYFHKGGFMHKKGFTLAEVLITLGIIGVVAAIVMPGVIRNFKVRQLEMNFKKVDTIVQQAIQKAAMEMNFNSYNNLTDLCCTVKAASISPEEKASCDQLYKDFNSVWEKQFKGAKKIGISAFFPNPVVPRYDFWG